MSEEKVMLACDMCGKNYQHGPHQYEGHNIPLYGISVCESCWRGNWDGWAPHLEDQLLSHLKKNGLPIPPRNSKGWFPRS